MRLQAAHGGPPIDTLTCEGAAVDPWVVVGGLVAGALLFDRVMLWAEKHGWVTASTEPRITFHAELPVASLVSLRRIDARVIGYRA